MVQGGVIMLPLACSLSYVVLKHMRLFLVPCFVSALVPSPKNSILPPAPPPHTGVPPYPGRRPSLQVVLAALLPRAILDILPEDQVTEGLRFTHGPLRGLGQMQPGVLEAPTTKLGALAVLQVGEAGVGVRHTQINTEISHTRTPHTHTHAHTHACTHLRIHPGRC